MKINIIFFIILFSLFTIVGLIGLIKYCIIIDKINEWELVDGIIVKNFISNEINESIDSGGKQMVYKPIIYYKYTVGGKEYLNDSNNNILNAKIYYGNKKHVEKYLNKYMEEESVKIIYNKNNPQESIIETDFFGMKLSIFCFFIILLLIGIIGNTIIIMKYYKTIL
ncbi:hypothetical protein FACS1894110_15840 [Spirochaetia bacterium]|nr:hypothetical protein FACS1894110_15840 [Spirochaetia bacterium]